MGRPKGSGNGTIYKRDKIWRGQITINGKRYSFTGPTKSSVSKQITELKTQFYNGELNESKMTVAELTKIWLKRKERSAMTEQSLIRLEAMINNHLLPAFGEMKLSDLNRSVIEEKYARIFQEKTGRDYKEKTYSHSTVNALSSQFRKMLQFAVQEGYINKNPHIGVELHKLRPPKKVYAYTLDENKKILDYTLNNGPLYWIYWLLVTTGMRFGEAVALTWDDVDLKKGTIDINKISVELHGSPFIQNRTKTNAGMRNIYISRSQIAVLRDIYNYFDQSLNYRNLVIPNTRYGIITSANSRRRWMRVCAELDIPYHGIHALRHTWATRALESGAPVKTVSAMLGHKNVITTMNIYQDVFKESQNTVLEGLEQLFADD